ncbi:MAG TPA: hypothetical protein ENJ09_12140 [Planctomycetes bacterium]|nr:hypothetical protein [Planctomycetota bacterium]
MNLFCRIFGHTWVPEIETPQVRWNTTKDMVVLEPTVDGQGIRHLEVCRRCGEQRVLPPRAHDADPIGGDVAQAG